MVCVCVCMWVYRSFIYCLQPQATFLFLTPPCTGTNVNVSPPISPPPPRFPLSLFLSLPFAPSPPRNLPQALHLSGLSACFFIWLVATGGSTLADYNSAASHFRFIRCPLPLCTPSQPATLTTLASINPDTQQFLITPMPNTPPPSSVPSHQPYLPPSISAENLARMPQDKKKGRNIVAVEAFKLVRQLVLYYYLGLCHWWWPGRVENIDRMSLKAFSRLHWQSLSGPLIARLAALAGTQEKTLTVPYFMVAFNHSLGPESGLITVRK